MLKSLNFSCKPYSRKHLLFCGIAACALAPAHSALANPSGGNVVSGQATISHNGGTTTIDQLSGRAIIEWQDFSISQGELTQFLQNGSDAAVLNKVISNLPSNILGSLKANGNVFLINPNGVVIGNGAQINANSFIASTLNISNADFMDGGDLTFEGPSQAAIVNLGEVRAGQGDVYLLARQVRNEGFISAPQGEVGLAAGSEIYLSADDGRGRRVTVKANDFALALKDKIGVENSGVIEAARAILATHNGDIYDMAINNSGNITASGMTTNADGSIDLFATSSGSRSAGKVRNSGTLKARNYDGGGGAVKVTGHHITLASSSMIDVSAAPTYVAAPVPGVKPDAARARADNRGNNGGGTVLVGGDYQGQGTLQTAQTTHIEAGSVIAANAGQDGDGGKIIVWADGRTDAGGTFEAIGGAQSGNGGFIETSGKDVLKVDGAAIINIAAGNDTGRGGQWLLDPTNITITDGGGDVDTATINATLNGGGDVTIQTADAGADDGDIFLTNATIDKSVANNDATLTLRAHRRIRTTNATINSSSGDALSVVFNSNSDSVDGGRVRLENTVINTNGGNLTIGGGSNPLLEAAKGIARQVAGVELINSQINTGTGFISLRGEGYDDAAATSQVGVTLFSGSVLSTTSGDITLQGRGGNGISGNMGIELVNAGTFIRSVSGDIVLNGRGGFSGSAGDNNNHGVYIRGGAQILSTGTGANAATITISGQGALAEDANYGVHIDDTGTLISSVDGDITITGEGGSDGTAGSVNNYGLYLRDGAGITSTGTTADAAKITIDGTGGAGEDSNRGVLILDSTTLISSAYGDISITGQGGSNGTSGSSINLGVHLFNGADLTSTGVGANAATITIDGTGGAGESDNWGFRSESAGTVLSSVDGDISITGRGGSNGSTSVGASNHGVSMGSSLVLSSTGTGADAANITINGIAGGGLSNNRGIDGFFGLDISTIDGDILLTGQGGSTGSAGSSNNSGVHFTNGAAVSSTGVGAGAGTITIDGKGDAGEDINTGVLLTGAGTAINSVDGDISVTGRGGSNGQVDGNDNWGISISNGAFVYSTGVGVHAAGITLNGTGGAGEDNNHGVTLRDAGTDVTSVDGDISITGRGGSNGTAGVSNYGFYLSGTADVTSTGTTADAATITIDGTGGAGEGNNYGVRIEHNSTSVRSVMGDISITGRGGSNGLSASSNNFGVYLNNFAQILSTGVGVDAAKINLDGTAGAGQNNNYGVILNDSVVLSSIDGAILIDGQGGSNGLSGVSTNLGFYALNSSTISSTGTTADAATITVNGIGGAGEDNNNGVRIENAGTLLTSAYGDITITGQAGSNGEVASTNNYGVYVNDGADITSTGVGAGAAKITIDAIGGAGDDRNYGLYLNSAGSVLTSFDGDISITARGGANGSSGSVSNFGFISTGGTLSSTGVGANAATITIDAYGGDGEDNNYGYYALANSILSSVDGDISITGQGGSNGRASSGFNYGVYHLSDSIIRSTGTGVDAANITINGEGGDGNSNDYGVVFRSDAIVDTVDGDILVDAYANDSIGLFIDGGTLITSTGTGVNAGNISLSGTREDSGTGVLLNSAGTLIQSAAGDISLTAVDSTISSDSTSLIRTTDATGDIVISASDISATSTFDVTSAGDLTVKPYDAASSVGLGAGAGDLSLNAAEISGLSAAGRVVFGNSLAAAGVVNIDGISAFNNYDVYGGSIVARNVSNIDGSSSTYTARIGDLTVFENDLSSAIGADIIDDVKVNFRTLAGDLILAPETASDSIGIAGEAGAFTLSQADLSGFSQVGRNVVVGDPTSGSGVVRIGALDLSAESYGVGFYGAGINLQGAVQSGADLVLGGDSIFFNNHDLIADDDVILTTQNTALDIGVSGGAGAIAISDLVLDDIFAGNDGSGDLIIGDAQTGSGDINIDGLDLSAQTYGLKFYGQRINLSDASVSSGADLTFGGDTLLNFTAVQNAKGSIEIAPRSSVLVSIDEGLNQFTYNGDVFGLALLNQNSDAVGGEGLILGSAAGGDLTWISAAHDFGAIDARTGGILTLQNTNLAASYGLGDGTSGDITYTTAQLEGFVIGQQLVIGDAAASTGAIDIADLSAADMGYGLNASGGSIDIGGWNGGANDVILNARTGSITTQSGLITAANLTLNAAGNVATSANRLATKIDSLVFASGGDVYVNEADALTINASSNAGAGVIEIATTDGAVDLAGDLSVFGDTLIAAGGTDRDLTVTGEITSAASAASTLNLRAGGTIDFVTSGDTITNSNGAALNVILNADRDGNKAGAIKLDDITITTNGGNVTMGGGADPLAGYAYGTASYINGVNLSGVNIDAGAGDIVLRGHGLNEHALDDQRGVHLRNATVFTTTSGDITLDGVGGAGDDGNYGVYIQNAGTSLTSVDGDISVIGQGGSNGQTGSNSSRGIYVRDGARIESTGVGVNAGEITLNGSGGAGEDSNTGVLIENLGTAITSIDGNISITGQGGSNGQTGSNYNRGVYLGNGARIASTGVGTNAGTVTLNGIGAAGEDGNYGVYLNNAGTLLTSVDGDVYVVGVGGANGQKGSSSIHGIFLVGGGGITSTGVGTNAAKITLHGSGGVGEDAGVGVNLKGSGTLLASVDGDISVTGVGASNGQASSNSNLGIYVVGGADIASTGVGANAANITLNGTAGAGEDYNYGIHVNTAGTSLTSVDGDITLNGVGGSHGLKGSTSNRGVFVDAGAVVLSTGTGANAGNITLNGTGSAGVDANYGVSIENGGSIVRAIDGDISITGQGGSYGRVGSSRNHGVLINGDAQVQSRGTGDNAGTITIDGTGGAGEDDNYGVRVSFSGSEVSSIDGDISITGRGGSYGQTDSDNNRGIHLYVSSLIESLGTDAGAAKITIHGTGGAGHDGNEGIRMESQGIQSIRSAYGDISLTGVGQTALNGDSNEGIEMGVGNISSTGVGADAAKITLNGTGANGDDSNNGVNMRSNTALSSVRSIDGDILITGQGGTAGRRESDSNRGIFISSSTDITSTGTGEHAANITLNGTGVAGDDGNYGVEITSLSVVSVVDGDIAITGRAGSDGRSGSTANYGVNVRSGANILSTGVGDGAGSITINGIGGDGDTRNYGVGVGEAGTLISTIDGDLNIVGQAGAVALATSGNSYGVDLFADAVISSTGTGANAGRINIEGTGGAGRNLNFGVHISSDGTVTSIDGDVEIAGRGGANATMTTNNFGFSFTDANVTSTGTGADAANITLRATGVSTGQDMFITSSNFTTAGGDINIIAEGQSGLTFRTGSVVSTLNQGNVSVLLDGGFGWESASTISADGTLTIAPSSVMNASIGIGGTSGDIRITDAVLANLTAGAGFVFGDRVSGTGAIDIDSVVFAAGKDIAFYGGAIDLDGGITNAQNLTFGGTSLTTSAGALAATNDITFLVDALDLSGGAAAAGRNIMVAPRAVDSSIGLGTGVGTLSLDAAALALLDATDELIIGYEGTGTGAVNVDNLDLSAETYDVSIYGGALSIRNGLQVGGEFLGQAHTGNIGVFDTTIQAVGVATLDAQAGQFKTNMDGATLFNVIGGNYALYTGNFLESDVLPLQASSVFTYGANSTTAPRVGLAAGVDHVVLRDSIGTSALDTPVFVLNNEIQQFAQQPVALLDLSNAPAAVLRGSTGRVSSTSDSAEPAPASTAGRNDSAERTIVVSERGGARYVDNAINNTGFDGVGINTANCTLSTANVISCNAEN